MASAADIDALARTMLGEAANQGSAGMQAVGNVAMNRLATGQWGNSLYAVVHAPNQFSAWNSASSGGNNLVAVPASSPEYQQAYALAQQVADGTLPDITGGAQYYYAPAAMTPAGSVPSWLKSQDTNGTLTIGDQVFLPQHPVPPANVTPQDPPFAYGMNDSGGPDDRSADPNYYPPSTTPIPLALANNAGAAPSLPVSIPAPQAPEQQTVQIGNSLYNVGQTYQTADGSSFTANADGTFSKTASAPQAETPQAETPIQLAFDLGNPNSMLNHTISGAKGLPGQVMQTGPALAGAASSLGNFFGSLFGGNAPAPTTAAAPTVTSSDLPPLSNFSGSPDDRQAPPVPGLPDPYQPSSGPLNYSGSPDDRNYQTPPSSSPAPVATSHGSNDGSNGGWADFFTGAAPANSISLATSAHGGGSTSDGPLNYSGPDTTINASGSPSDRGSQAFPDNYGAAAVAAAPQTIQKQVAVANPAYQAWLKDQNSAIYGVEGVPTPTLDANGNVSLPSSYLGAKQPAPPKTVLQTIHVANPAYKPQQAFSLMPPAAAPAAGPIPSTNGYTYLPNGSGGYTRAGQVDPSLTPSQQYALAAAPAIASQPNGNRSSFSGVSPGGSISGVS